MKSYFPAFPIYAGHFLVWVKFPDFMICGEIWDYHQIYHKNVYIKSILTSPLGLRPQKMISSQNLKTYHLQHRLRTFCMCK